MPRISAKEHGERIGRAAEAMRGSGVDCLFLLPGSNFTYLTGLRFVRERHRLLCALLTREGELAILGPTFEERKMGSGPVPAEVVAMADEEDQHGRAAEWIARACGRKIRLGVELTTGRYHEVALRAALPEATFADPTDATDRLRAIKSPAEVACLAEAAARTRARMERVPGLLEEGMTERDLARLFGPGAMIQFGLTTSMPNEVAGDRRLAPGDGIVIDAGDRVEGYRSDLTRTFFFGEPGDRLREVYRVVDEAELAAIDAARPGAPAEEVDLAARRVIEAAGLGGFFTHRGGHGIGLDFHEIPICVAGNREPLEPGMVLTAEPGVYIPGAFGVRLEDDLLIAQSGCELLCPRGPIHP